MHFTDINIFARLYYLLDFKLCNYEVILGLSQLLKLYPDRAVYLGFRTVIMDTSGESFYGNWKSGTMSDTSRKHRFIVRPYLFDIMLRGLNIF